MKSAIVGLGTISKTHISILKELNEEVVAVCDCNAAALEKYPQYKGYVDYQAMLDECRPDVVHICTPHYLHTQMIIAALKRDINVLCEKPLCIKKEDVQLIIDAEKKSKAQMGVCFQNRYLPQNVYVKNYLQGKKILYATGKLVWHRDANYYRSSDWRGKWATEGGGVLINQAIHTLDLLQYFTGMPNSVCATVSNLTLQGTIEVEDTATLICYGQDAGFTLFATNGGFVTAPAEIEIRTEENLICIVPNGVLVDDQLISFKQKDKIYGKPCYGSGHMALIVDFYDCVRTGRKFSIGAEEGAKAVQIVLTAYESQGCRKSI